ncbi:cytochrome b5 reductase 4 isoform X2 [Onthophagus taurus]|uniref:cytochrome b5 reductase 4 isoform X2 n=1 Tax=Onthophagus taurus TaxID=166361 RepID=UPI000C20A31B|nr:cytochrome b5 reductase 4 isoform X2 [Onthophagus taurus]
MPCLNCCRKKSEDVIPEVLDNFESRGVVTGNPRNKCALQPGHSLMDWIRLGSSGKDLTGVGSKAGQLTITLKELAQHSTETDVWLALRGRVYNVTHYLPFHPGGIDEIMKGAGKDATHLFDQVHPWVNYEQILNKCFLGRLIPEADITVEELFPNNIPKNENYNNKDENKIENKIIEDNIILPRFDWIQKMDSITIIFYTKSYSNCQVEVNPPNQDNSLNIYLTFNSKLFINEIKFNKGIKWPCQIKVNQETGKIEIIFKKLESGIWENFGILTQKRDETTSLDIKLKYTVINKIQVNQNTCLIELERVDNSKLTIPIGKHVRVFGKIKGEEMSRSYTPVPASLFKQFKPSLYTTDNVCLMVKNYPNGNISKYVCGKSKYDIIEISRPLGAFNLQDIENKELFLLLAGGTGLTPMLGLISFLLERRVKKSYHVTLLFFNRTDEDILFKTHFDTLHKDDNRFNVEYILSQPSSKWTGLSGHVSSPILEDAIKNLIKDTGYLQKDVYVAACGPTVFTNLSHTLLKGMGVGDDQIYLFLG